MAVATSATSLLPPRFLLPALSPMWRATSRASAPRLLAATPTVRHASTKSGKSQGTPSKPIVLEKPTKFNPPSHGSRLPRKQGPKHYGGAMSEGEKAAQRKTDYPGMMAPEGTRAHSFIHSRRLHLLITLGTLATLALSTFALNFAHTSPFKHLLPPASEFWSGPISFIRTWLRVMALHERDRNEKVIAQHERHTNDVAKRAYFRKAHGLDKENPIQNFLGGPDDGENESPRPVSLGEAQAAAGGVGGVADADAAVAAAMAAEAAPAGGMAAEGQEEKKRKRFGIF